MRNGKDAERPKIVTTQSVVTSEIDWHRAENIRDMHANVPFLLSSFFW